MKTSVLIKTNKALRKLNVNQKFKFLKNFA